MPTQLSTIYILCLKHQIISSQEKWLARIDYVIQTKGRNDALSFWFIINIKQHSVHPS